LICVSLLLGYLREEWQTEDDGQLEQPHPQDGLPFLRFLIRFTTIKAIIAAIITLIMIVDKLFDKKFIIV
jgi:hypothetical protein